MSVSNTGTLKSRVITAKENRRFDRLYSVIAFLGVYFITTAFVVPALPSSGLVSLAAFGGVLVLMLLGWWLQAGFCAATRSRRASSSRSYEQENKFYSTKLAFPVAIVAVVLAVIASRMIDRYLFRRAQEVVGSYYDENSIIPLAGACVVFLVVMVGSFVWFFPYDRLLTGRGVFVGAILLMVSFMLYSVTDSNARGMVAVCFIGYALCAVLAANQYAITRSYRGTVVSFLTPRARRYNMLLVLALTLAFVAFCGLFYVVAVGIRTLVLLVVAAVLSSTDDSDLGRLARQDPEYQANLNEYIFGSSKPNESLNYWLFILFFLCVGTALVVFLARHTDAMKRMITLVKDWIVSLFELIFRPILDYIAPGDGDDIFCNYLDEEEKLQDAEIREYLAPETERRMTYREFTSELRARHTPEERYRFAYSFFLSQLRSMQMFVKKSDTPREVAERVLVSRNFEDDPDLEKSLAGITEEYERIEYADAGASDGDEALEGLCRLIKNNM